MTERCSLFDDWHVVAQSAELAERPIVPARLLGQDLVVWRSPKGIEVWEDRCAHRGVRLSLGSTKGGRLVCPYHGWEYEPGGQCVRYPAHEHQAPTPRASAKTFAVAERYGLVWVCLGTPYGVPPAIPEMEAGGYRLYFGGRFAYATSAQRGIENFLDISHFPFVHSGYLGAEPHTEVKDYDVSVGPAGLSVTSVRVWQPKPTNTLDIDGLEVGYEYYVPQPLTARLVKDVGITKADGTPAREVVILMATPVEPEQCIGWVLVASNYDETYSDADVKAFTRLIIEQDLGVVESQRPKLLPLDVGSELHLKSDRTAVEYRRWLKSRGVRFGTLPASP